MENKWHYIIGAIFIPCLIGGITLLDTHPYWACTLFTLGGISIIWGIWPLLFRRVSPITSSTKAVAEKITVLSENDKGKIIVLMKTVNALEDKMSRYFDESLNNTVNANDRVTKYQSLLNGVDFKNLWDKYLSQRAIISVISPELEDNVRLLLSLIQGCHRITLSKQYTDELPNLNRQLDEATRAIENVRKGIKQTIKKLIE